jgi:1-acyl-sn-glycerol-3-phosphate acyltransferase
METYFPGDTYDTPRERRQSMGNRLFFGNRFYFISRFVYIILKYRKYAVKGLYDNEKWIENSYEIFKAIEDCGGRFHIKGLDNLKQSKEPVVIVGNHMSTLETVVFPSLIAPMRPFTFVVKDALVKSKVFGPIMRSMHPVVIERKNPRKDLHMVLTKGKEVLANDRSIVIFPQGTRQVRFDPKQFNTLGVKLAVRAAVKIIPAAVKTDFWGNGKWMKEFGPLSPDRDIHMVFGKPTTVSGNGRKEHQKTVEFILSHLETWGGDVEGNDR